MKCAGDTCYNKHRHPNQMKSKSLSPQVSEHLNNAMSELRSALWHASRNELPAVLSQIAQLINDTEKVATVSDILSHLESMKDKGDVKWSDFIDEAE